MADETNKFSRSSFQKCVKGLLNQYGLGFDKLKSAQENLLFNYLSGHDCIGVLPTNYGKSIIFHLIPGVYKLFHPDANPIVFVITPINALIQDQIQRCAEIGITGLHLCQENMEAVKLGNFDILFSSPECLLEEKFRHVLLMLSPRVIGIVIDEVHVVVKWGLPSTQKQAFRKMYAEVGNLRAIFNKPFLCLTATANKKTTKKIVNMLQLKNYKIERLSPEKPNVKISVNKVKITSDFEEIISYLKPLLEDFDRHGHCEKAIIYCSSIKLCGDIFMLFDRKYRNGTVGIFHGDTPKPLKLRVMEEFSKDQGGKCFFIVATSALGMGVNIKHIRHIIHAGLPSDVEAYIQEIGRAGRDGQSSNAILFYRPCDISHCNDNDLERIIKNKENECRRMSLLKCFNEIPDAGSALDLHECCDVCEKFCVCEKCTDVPEVEIPQPEPLQKVRSASEMEKKVVLDCLDQLHLAEKDVNLIMENVDFIKTESNILSLGIEEPLSVFVNQIFVEVFYCDNEANDASEEDDNIDLLSLNQPYTPLNDYELDSDDDIFWQDLFG
ncbi:probable ATP-dependent DNA helicase RecS [Clytia hemisphaerica]|uniref:DNA 3'-5' helicase n=1 Tax=Clytia hemisphaerica TaxID=252671 RepID=A0A7M5V251_9CNID